MISKSKLKKIHGAAGGSVRFLDCIPLDIQKKLKAEQVAGLCEAFAQVEKRTFEAANAERMARNVARFHSQWLRKLKEAFAVPQIELPRLAIGVSSVRAWFRK